MRSILQFLLITFVLVSATNARLNCRRCLVDVRLGSTSTGVVPLAPPVKPASEKKPNVGAVVGFTFLLVFILVCFFVCVYRFRRTGSRGSSRHEHQLVVQPSVPKKENPPQGVVKAGKVEHRQQGQRSGEASKDDKKKLDVVLQRRLEERNQRPDPLEKEGRGQNGRGKERNQRPDPREEGKGQNERGKERNQQPDPREDINVGGQNGRVKERNPRAEPVEGGKVGEQINGKGKEKNQQVDVAEDQNAGGLKRKVKEGNRGPGPPEGGINDRPKEKEDEKNEAKKERRRKRNEGRNRPPGEKVDKDEQRKKRDREVVKQPNPLDEDVGRQNKRGKEANKELDEENIGGQNGKQPEKDEVEQQRRNVIRNGKQPQQPVLEHQNSLGLPNKYTLRYLQSVTNYFDPANKIGGGGFGIVYKGTLSDGTMIAAKCLIYGGRIDDFKNEVEALGRADHSNLVKLIGYCTDGMTKILVYEYMSNGSLDKWIFRPNSSKYLAWPEMKNIIKGIAKGLVYLHEKCDKTILHRDLKPHNVLLDEKKNAKLCDFGLAKLLNKDQTSTSTNWAGTRGYMAPEVMKGMKITDKVDVYSFGIVVLEVMFGKRYQYLVTSDQHNKTDEVKLNDLINNLTEDMKKYGKEIEKIGDLAKWCIREIPDERPTMKVILAALRAIDARFKEVKARRN